MFRPNAPAQPALSEGPRLLKSYVRCASSCPLWRFRALAAASTTPLGTVSRVVSFLETEALLTRDERKQIVAVDWSALLSRWSNVKARQM